MSRRSCRTSAGFAVLARAGLIGLRLGPGLLRLLGVFVRLDRFAGARLGFFIPLGMFLFFLFFLFTLVFFFLFFFLFLFLAFFLLVFFPLLFFFFFFLFFFALFLGLF